MTALIHGCSMPTDQQRAEFEAHVRSLGAHPGITDRDTAGEYVWHDVKLRWEGWQAALSQQADLRANLKRATSALRDADAALSQQKSQERLLRNLAMLIKRLVYFQLHPNPEQSKATAETATEYLRRNGLLGSPLRGEDGS